MRIRSICIVGAAFLAGLEPGWASAAENRSNDTAAFTARVVSTSYDAEVPSQRVRAGFREAYSRIGAPRMAVFWDRQFSDRLRDMRLEGRVVLQTDRTGTEHEYSRRSVSMGIRKPVFVDAEKSVLTEIEISRFQAGYLQPLIEEGVRVIDRAAIMRLSDAIRRLDGSAMQVDDRQLIETDALRNHADLLIQIALSPSGDSRTGVFFHVSIVEVNTGRIRARFFHDGYFPEPERPPSRQVWKATREGYVRVYEEAPIPEERRVTLEEMGKILVAQTMIALSRP